MVSLKVCFHFACSVDAETATLNHRRYRPYRPRQYCRKMKLVCRVTGVTSVFCFCFAARGSCHAIAGRLL